MAITGTTIKTIEQMAKREASERPLLEWGIAGQAFSDQAESGDQYLVEPFEGGMLVAVVDGLGHGNKAAAVAKAAVATLKGKAHEPVTWLLKRCHKELRGTRGVVMSLASFRRQSGDAHGTMTWTGVGNVGGVLLRANGSKRNSQGPERVSLFLRGGILGYQIPSPRAFDLSVSRGDTLVFATDGLRSSFANGLALEDAPQRIAERIFGQYGRGTDDALVLVARYLGRTPVRRWA